MRLAILLTAASLVLALGLIAGCAGVEDRDRKMVEAVPVESFETNEFLLCDETSDMVNDVTPVACILYYIVLEMREMNAQLAELNGYLSGN